MNFFIVTPVTSISTILTSYRTVGGVSGPRGIVGQALPSTLPPILAADHSGPGAEGNTGSHRVSVISPRLFVSEDSCGKDSAEPEPDP